MEFKGTRGKWEVMCASSFGIPFIVYFDNETIFQCYNRERLGSEIEAKANALIISKSPEMLEALKNFITALDNGKVILAEEYEIAKKLIKEATEI